MSKATISAATVAKHAAPITTFTATNTSSCFTPRGATVAAASSTSAATAAAMSSAVTPSTSNPIATACATLSGLLRCPQYCRGISSGVWQDCLQRMRYLHQLAQ